MRFATLAAGEGDNAIDVSVTQLVGEAGGIGPNINRWRRQLGLAPASDAELKSIAKPIRAQGAGGIMVDLVATAASDGGPPPRMLAAIFRTPTHTWFVKATGPRDVVEKHRAAFIAFCESVRFEAEAAPQARATPVSPPTPDAAQIPTWGALPAGWSEDASPAAMSVASFHISDAAQQAAMTITPLGGTQDLLGNVNRWRRQVGLGPLSTLAADAARPIEVAGDAGTLVDVAGSERHTIGAIVVRAGRTWFYKLSGPDPLVAGQAQAFESLLGSIRFDGDHHE